MSDRSRASGWEPRGKRWFPVGRLRVGIGGERELAILDLGPHGGQDTAGGGGSLGKGMDDTARAVCLGHSRWEARGRSWQGALGR